MLKKKVLLTLKDESLTEQITIALEGLFDVKVDVVLPVSSVLRSLDRSQFVGLVTARSEREGQQIHADLKRLGSELTHLVYEKESGVKGLIIKAYSALASLYRQEDEFSPFPLMALDSLRDVLGALPELFIKLPSERLVKVHHGGESCEAERVLDYRERGVTTFYLRKTVFFDYLNRRYEFIARQISSFSPDNTLGQRELAIRVHQDLVRDIRLSLGAKLGIPTPILVATGEMVGKLLQERSFAKPWFDRLEKSLEGNHYLENLALLTGHFASWILTYTPYNEVKWHERMMMAAVVMDLALQDEKVARVRKVHEGATTVGMLQAMMIKTHPQKALELLAHNFNFGGEVEQLVAQHHERFDGSGFPRKLHINQIPPLSRLFILAHQFADQWLEDPRPESFRRFLSELQSGPANKVIWTLLASLEKSLEE